MQTTWLNYGAVATSRAYTSIEHARVHVADALALAIALAGCPRTRTRTHIYAYTHATHVASVSTFFFLLAGSGRYNKVGTNLETSLGINIRSLPRTSVSIWGRVGAGCHHEASCNINRQRFFQRAVVVGSTVEFTTVIMPQKLVLGADYLYKFSSTKPPTLILDAIDQIG